MLVALTTGPSGEFPLYRSGKGRWVAKWGYECTSRVRGRWHLHSCSFTVVLKSLISSTIGVYQLLCLGKVKIVSPQQRGKRNHLIPKIVVFLMSCLSDWEKTRFHLRFAAAVLNLWWWQRLQLWVLSNTPNELICCWQCLWDGFSARIWLHWLGATTKH